MGDFEDQIRASAARMAAGLEAEALWLQDFRDESRSGAVKWESRTLGVDGRPAEAASRGGTPAVSWFDSPYMTFVRELMVGRSGEYEFSFSRLPSWPARFVYEDDFRFPCFYRPGGRLPTAATTNDGRPTDPQVLAEVQALVARGMRRSWARFLISEWAIPRLRSSITRPD
jgi:hypothetical protein